MPHALPTHLGLGHFHTTTIADYAAVFDALVFSAGAFPVLYRPEYPLAEQPARLRLECPVVDRFRVLNLPVRPGPDRVRRRNLYSDFIKLRLNYRPVRHILRAFADTRVHGKFVAVFVCCHIYYLWLHHEGYYASFSVRTSRHAARNSLTSTLNDSGVCASRPQSPLIIDSYIFKRPFTSSDLTVSISCSV